MPRIPRSTFRCHTCGEVFVGYETAERHADAAHHGARIDIVLPTSPDQPELVAVVEDVPTGDAL